MAWGFNDKRPFHDRAWKRADMAGWDRRWHALSPEARRHFLDDFKAVLGSLKPHEVMRKVPEAARRELIDGGFAEVRKGVKGDELHAAEAAKYFVSRLRLLLRCRLLDGSSQLASYASAVYDPYLLNGVMGQVVEKALKVGYYELPSSPLSLFVDGPRWAGWVADFLDSAPARDALAAIKEAGGRVSLARLGELLPGRDENVVRGAADALVNHLALVEGIDPATKEIIVGYPPGAVASLSAAAKDRALVERTPTDVLPDAGLMIPDLRALLLELSSAAAQLRQTGELFAKDEDRLTASLTPMPEWLAAPPGHGARINSTLNRAHSMGLLTRFRRGGKELVGLSPAGDDWMAMPSGRQYEAVFGHLRLPGGADDWELGDRVFLGVPFAVMARKPSKRRPSAREVAREADTAGLRRALQAAFTSLPVGRFVTFASVLDHLSEPSRNPVLLGKAVGDVVMVGDDYNVVLPLEEVVEATTRRFLQEFISSRLWPFGCIKLGFAGDENVLAATPRLAMYFDPAAPIPEGAAHEAARVVVQPDFTVIVIGTGTAASADLAAFAARDRAGASPGSMTFRLTREDALRAIQAGLTGDEMVARLKRHASTPVPANVETQLRTWAGQARVATTAHMLILRCPDEETAGRAMAALGKKAERLGPACVGLPDGKLPAALRNKLAAQGVLLREGEED